jgi:hypothetical protein
MQSEMEETMAERSVAWDTGEAIPETPFRNMITTADTGGRFPTLSVVLGPGDLVLPHSHRDEDEFSFVFRGCIGGRLGEHYENIHIPLVMKLPGCASCTTASTHLAAR